MITRGLSAFIWFWSILVTVAACGDDDAPAADAAALADVSEPSADAAAADASGPDAPPAADAGQPLAGSTCAVAIDLSAQVGASMQSTTPGGANQTTASCGDANGRERYFFYQAGATPVDLLVDVLVDEAAMAPYDAVVSARSDCFMADTELACHDGGWGERLEVRAVSGVVFLVVDASNQFGGANQGDFTIEVHPRAIVGAGGSCDPAGVLSRCGDDLRCAGATCIATSPALSCVDATDLTADLADGSAVVTSALPSTDPDYLQASCAFEPTGHPEQLVRFTTTATKHLVATTDDAASNFDTVLSLHAADCATETACAADIDVGAGNYFSRLDVAALPAGTYVLAVQAESDLLFGAPTITPAYQLTVTLN